MQKINDIKHCHHIYLGLQIDIQTAMKYVQAHPILGQTKIIVCISLGRFFRPEAHDAQLYGQSLGGAACFYATSKHRDAVSVFRLSAAYNCILKVLLAGGRSHC